MDFFRNFRIEYGTLDIASERLYELATGTSVRYLDAATHRT